MCRRPWARSDAIHTREGPIMSEESDNLTCHCNMSYTKVLTIRYTSTLRLFSHLLKLSNIIAPPPIQPFFLFPRRKSRTLALLHLRRFVSFPIHIQSRGTDEQRERVTFLVAWRYIFRLGLRKIPVGLSQRRSRRCGSRRLSTRMGAAGWCEIRRSRGRLLFLGILQGDRCTGAL